MKKFILLLFAFFPFVLFAQTQKASELQKTESAPKQSAVAEPEQKKKSMENKEEKVYLHLSNDRRNHVNPQSEVKGEIHINTVEENPTLELETAKSLLKAFEAKRSTVLTDPVEKKKAEENGWLESIQKEIEKLQLFISEQENSKEAER